VLRDRKRERVRELTNKPEFNW